MKKKPYRVKVGDWVCTFVKVTSLHGTQGLVVRIGGTEATILRAEVWHPDHDGPANEAEKGTQ